MDNLIIQRSVRTFFHPWPSFYMASSPAVSTASVYAAASSAAASLLSPEKGQLFLKCCNLRLVSFYLAVLFLQNLLLFLHNALNHTAVHHSLNDVPQRIHCFPGSLSFLVNDDVRVLFIVRHTLIVKVPKVKPGFRATPRSTTLPMRFSISS